MYENGCINCHSEGIFVCAGRFKDTYTFGIPSGQHDKLNNSNSLKVHLSNN